MCPCSNGGQGHPGLCWLFPLPSQKWRKWSFTHWHVWNAVPSLRFPRPHSKLHAIWVQAGEVESPNPEEERFSEGSIFCLHLPSKREENQTLSRCTLSAGIGQEATDTVWNTWKYKNSWCKTLVFDWTWGWSNTGWGYPVNLWDLCPWSCSGLNRTLFYTTWFE